MNVVNKLIYSRLAAGQEIALPDIGALVIGQNEAKVVSGKVIAPEREIDFLDDATRGDSIIDIIANENGITTDEAQKIYEDWQAEFVLDVVDVDFEDAGELKNGQFYVSDKLFLEMNPFGDVNKKRKDMRGNSKSHYGWLWGLGGVIVGMIIVMAFFCIVSRCDSVRDLVYGDTSQEEVYSDDVNGDENRLVNEYDEQQFVDSVDNEVVTDTLIDDQAQEPTDGQTAQVADTAQSQQSQARQTATTEQQAAKTEPATKSTTPAATKPQVAARYYLIAGVFSVTENADELIRENRYYSDNYQKLSYKGNVAVSVYSSTSRSSVEQRMFELADIDTELWILRQ